MSDDIIVARDDLRPTSDLSVREAAQDIHGEDIEFLDERSAYALDDDGPETTLAEWSE